MAQVASMSGVFAFGEDALANLYDIAIVTLPTSIAAEGVDLAQSGRIQNFMIPGVNLESYEVHYKSRRILMPTGKVERSNEFTFQLRVDKQFYFHALLQNWVNNVNNSGLYMDMKNYSTVLGDIIVKRVNRNMDMAEDTEHNAGWKLNRVWIKSISDLELDWSNGEPLLCEVTGAYGWIDDLTATIIADAAKKSASTTSASEPAPAADDKTQPKKTSWGVSSGPPGTGKL